MKQLIFVSIALIFITSLLPTNLSSQVILGDDPPEIDLGVPWDYGDRSSISLIDPRGFNNNQNIHVIIQKDCLLENIWKYFVRCKSDRKN